MLSTHCGIRGPKALLQSRVVPALLIPLGVVLLLACSGARGQAPRPRGPQAESMGTPARLTTETWVVSPKQALSVPELFRRGLKAFGDTRYEAALADFARVAEADPLGAWTPAALYNSGLALEELGRFKESAQFLAEASARLEEPEKALDAALRSIRLSVYLEEWQAAGQLARQRLDAGGGSGGRAYSSRQAIVLLSADALWHLQQGELAAAEGSISIGRSLIERHGLDGAGELPRDLAQLYYALGELRRLRGEAIVFKRPEDFVEGFEQRAQHLLDAQAAYSDVMRAKDAHWTAMAGYRVGELYLNLHRAVVAMPRPSTLDTSRRRQLFEAALRLRYGILLKKGLRMFEHTLAMAERTGETSTWVLRSKAAQRQLSKAVAEEEAAIAQLPFGRRELERVLGELQARQAAPTTRPGDRASQPR